MMIALYNWLVDNNGFKRGVGRDAGPALTLPQEKYNTSILQIHPLQVKLATEKKLD